MSLLIHILINGLIFAVILTAYLFFVMFKFSPRVWGFSDYPKAITEKVPPQTEEEMKKAKIIYIPFMLFGLGFPIISTLILEILVGGRIDFVTAFLNLFVIFMFGNVFDLGILDLLIVGTITPKFVVIPGTEDMDKEYKAFRISHAKGHVYGTILMTLLSLLIALIIWLL